MRKPTNDQQMTRKFILLFLILIFTQSCHPLFCDWKFGYEQLTEMENNQIVVGQYILSQKSKDYLKSEGYSTSPKLTILKSGKYKLTNIPKFILDWNEEGKTITDLEAKWSASCDPSYKCMIELYEFAVVTILENEDGVISIPITIGDGDACNGIIFEKTK